MKKKNKKTKLCLIKWAPHPSNISTIVGKEEEILVVCKRSRLIGKRRIARRYVSHITRNLELWSFIGFKQRSPCTKWQRQFTHSYIYIYIYILLILATSLSKILIKPKQSGQRLGQLVSQQSHLWLTICQKLVFTVNSIHKWQNNNDERLLSQIHYHTSLLTSYCPGPTLFIYRYNQKKKKK